MKNEALDRYGQHTLYSVPNSRNQGHCTETDGFICAAGDLLDSTVARDILECSNVQIARRPEGSSEGKAKSTLVDQRHMTCGWHQSGTCSAENFGAVAGQMSLSVAPGCDHIIFIRFGGIYNNYVKKLGKTRTRYYSMGQGRFNDADGR